MKLVRLTSGEEIIGNITEDSAGNITIVDGHQLIPAGEGKIGFMAFMAYSKNAESGVHIKERDVMFIVDPVDAMVDQVQNMLDAANPHKIITPKKQGIIV